MKALTTLERARAHLVVTGPSRLFDNIPLLGELVMGRDWPSRIWDLSETPFEPEKNGWHKIAGNPNSGRLPAHHASCFILETDRRSLHRQAGEKAAVPVLAFTLGRAVLATELLRESDNTYAVAVRAGTVDRYATLGTLDVRGGLLVAEHGVHVSQEMSVAELDTMAYSHVIKGR